MPAADFDHVANVFDRERVGIEANAVAAIDLQIEKGRCNPLRFVIDFASAGRGNGLDPPIAASDVDALAGCVMFATQPQLFAHLSPSGGLRLANLFSPMAARMASSPPTMPVPSMIKSRRSRSSRLRREPGFLGMTAGGNGIGTSSTSYSSGCGAGTAGWAE